MDADLDRLVSRRASQDKRRDPDALEPSYLESVRRHHEKTRRQNRAASRGVMLEAGRRLSAVDGTAEAAQLAAREQTHATF